MGTDISLFPTYAQDENRTTNYCLLVLKMLYEENPKFLGEVLGELVDEEFAATVGVRFRQQVKRKNTVPDGLIVQRPFTVYIETKDRDWFYNKQLEQHLAALDQETSGTKALIALGNFEALTANRFEKIEGICKDKYKGSIFFGAVTFEEFLASLPKGKVSKNLADVIDEFEDYLDEMNLLPRWKERLDVVNCSGRPDEVLSERVYICPAKGGAYNHKRAMYFGMYQKRGVWRVAQIEGVVKVDSGGEGELQWNNGSTANDDLIKQAKEKAERLRPGSDVRVFLLGDLHKTAFRKPTKGGMQGSKRYFEVNAKSVSDLANRLNGKTWDDDLG